MNLAKAFIPEDRRRALAGGRALPSHAFGAVLFADISGFTPLTEALARALGPRRGAEQLTQQLNRVYTALIDVVQCWGGSVIGFSGDAIACWFDGSATHGRASLAAVGCAGAMQDAMAGLAAVKVAGVQAALALKTAVVTGPVSRLLVGDPAIQSIDVLAGATLDALAAAEHSARQGEIVVDAATLAWLGDAVKAREQRTTQSGQPVTVLERLPSAWLSPVADEQAAPVVGDRLARAWVLPAIYERLRTEEGRFLAELRPATALFLQFAGLDFEHDPAAGTHLDAFVCWVQRVVGRYEGAVIQLTTGDKGSYLYAAFGAPIAHDDDAQRAVAAALDLRAPPAALAAIRDIRIGISQGVMRVGAYGSAKRMTYGVLGDATNMAARLMTQAGVGQIWLSAEAAEAVRERYDLAPMGTHSFKGKAEAQPVFAVIGARWQPVLSISTDDAAHLVGRAAELAQLDAGADALGEGRGALIDVEGEAGTGKSHLVAHFARRAATRGIRVLVAACQSTAQNTAYYAAQQLVRTLFAFDDAAFRSKEAQIARLEAAVRARDPAWLLRLPLLGDLLGLAIPDNPTTAAFDTRLRQAALAALVVEIVRRAAAERPLMLVVEDAHWLDEASRGLVLALARVASTLPILLLLVQRPLGAEQGALAAELADLPGLQLLRLVELDAEGTAQLVCARVRGDVDPLALAYVYTLAQGNPFFTEELVDALCEGNLWVQADGRWQFAVALVDALRRANCLVREGEAWRLAPNAPLTAAQMGVPASIQGLVLSRLDRLPETAKLTLKVASVIGRVFELDLLAAAHPSAPDRQTLAGQFQIFQARDFARLDVPEPRPIYLFKHNITQEVVYQTLLETQRQELHLSVAVALENQEPMAVERLAYHYGHGDLEQPAVRAKAITYVDASAWRAQREHANETALAYFDRGLQMQLRWEWLKGRAEVLHVLGRRMQEEATLLAMEELTPDRQVQQLAVALLWSDYYEATGDYERANDWVERAQALARALDDRRSAARCFNRSGLIAWRQGNYALATGAYSAALASATADGGLQDVASEARYGLGLVYRQQSQFDAARRQFEQDLAVNQELGNRQNAARALNALGAVSNLERDYAAAADLFQQALRIRETIGDRAGVGTSVLSLAQALGNMGDYSRVEPLLHQALAIQEAIHNPWEEMLVLNELGILYTAVGDFGRAFAHLARALERSDAIGSAIGAAYILCNLGQAQRDAGQLDTAIGTLQRGMALAQEQGDVNLEAIYLGDLALAHLRAGDFASAAAKAEQSLGLFAELEQPMSATVVLATLGAAHLGCDDRGAAATAVREALRILDDCGGEGPDYPQRDYWMCGAILDALGDRVESSRARLRARELLHQRAARISDPAMRHSFLTNVVVHREMTLTV